MNLPQIPRVELIGDLSDTVVLDGDILCYKAASAVQEDTEWDEHTITRTFSREEGRRCLKALVDKILRCLTNSGLHRETVIFALSGPSDMNFRRHLWPDYKANRSSAARPVGLKAMRDPELILSALPKGSVVIQEESLEADDLLGVYATEGYLCLSDDKDLKTCPGNIGKLTDTNGNLGVTYRSISEANWWLALQTLAGDSTDGIPGCPKVGLKTAEKLLLDFLENRPEDKVADFIVETYERYGLSAEDALRTFQMVYILRSDHIPSGIHELLWDSTNIKPPKN